MNIGQRNAAWSADTPQSGGGDTNGGGRIASPFSLYHDRDQGASDLSPAENDRLHRVYLFVLTWPVGDGAM